MYLPEIHLLILTHSCHGWIQHQVPVNTQNQGFSSEILCLSVQLSFFSVTSAPSCPWSWCGSHPTNQDAKGQGRGGRTASALRLCSPAFTLLSTQKACKCFSEKKGTESLSSLALWGWRHTFMQFFSWTEFCPCVLILMDAGVFRCHGYSYTVLPRCCCSHSPQLWLQPTFCYSY